MSNTEYQRFSDDVEPACIDRLNGGAKMWNEDPASAYPPNTAPLCGHCWPDVETDDNRIPLDYDHTDDADTVVRAIHSKSRPRTLHKKK